VSPIQIAAALAALGDGGLYRAPRVIDRITGAASADETPPAPAPRRVVRPETAAAMLAIMATVFEGGKQAGTASSIVVPGFRCGGKTGTAHKWDPVARQYATTRYLSSFGGLAPIDRPRLAIVVFVDEPSGGDYYGGKVAGPVFATIASEALRYLGVPGEPIECPPPPPGPPPNPLLVVLPPKTCLPPPKPGAPAAVVASAAAAPSPLLPAAPAPVPAPPPSPQP
jgi:cell division protein FtsI/penicillin-binding protein 2